MEASFCHFKKKVSKLKSKKASITQNFELAVIYMNDVIFFLKIFS